MKGIFVFLVATFDLVQSQFCTKQFKGNPDDCATYFQCEFGKLILRPCAPGTHWNEALNVCDWPWRAQCHRTGMVGQHENSVIDTAMGMFTDSPI